MSGETLTVQLVDAEALPEPCIWWEDGVLMPCGLVAARAAAKVMLRGVRGATGLSVEEIVCMAVHLQRLGVIEAPQVLPAPTPVDAAGNPL